MSLNYNLTQITLLPRDGDSELPRSGPCLPCSPLCPRHLVRTAAHMPLVSGSASSARQPELGTAEQRALAPLRGGGGVPRGAGPSASHSPSCPH